MEGRLRQVANPHSEKRMEILLDQMRNTVSEVLEKEVNRDEDDIQEDEVSSYFYENSCSCKKLAKCKSSKCICYVRGSLCNIKCHVGEKKSSCTNK